MTESETLWSRKQWFNFVYVHVANAYGFFRPLKRYFTEENYVQNVFTKQLVSPSSDEFLVSPGIFVVVTSSWIIVCPKSRFV